MPIVVIPLDYEMTEKHIRAMGLVPEFRLNSENSFNCEISKHVQPERLERMLNMILGVVAKGLFVGMTDLVFFWI